MIGALGAGLIMGGVGSALSIVDIIRGERMRKRAEENLKNLKRPMMEVPQAQRQQMELYRQMATQGMPGQQAAQNMMDLQAQRAYGNASRAATSSQDLLGVATNLGEQQQINQLDLAGRAADYQTNAMNQYASGLGNLAQTQQNMFNVNQMQPYQLKYETYANNIQQGRELVGSGMQGIGSSIGAATPFIAAGGGEDSWKRYAAMFGNGPITE
jgi:hypothetical protein